MIPGGLIALASFFMKDTPASLLVSLLRPLWPPRPTLV